MRTTNTVLASQSLEREFNIVSMAEIIQELPKLTPEERAARQTHMPSDLPAPR